MVEEGKRERVGGVVHHGAERKERTMWKGEGYKRDGIIGDIMVGKRRGCVKSGDGMTALRATSRTTGGTVSNQIKLADSLRRGQHPPIHSPTPHQVQPRLPTALLRISFLYSDIRNGGTQYLISVHNVGGNIKVGDPIPHDRSPLICITRHWLMIYFATFPTLNHQSQIS